MNLASVRVHTSVRHAPAASTRSTGRSDPAGFAPVRPEGDSVRGRWFKSVPSAAHSFDCWRVPVAASRQAPPRHAPTLPITRRRSPVGVDSQGFWNPTGRPAPNSISIVIMELIRGGSTRQESHRMRYSLLPECETGSESLARRSRPGGKSRRTASSRRHASTSRASGQTDRAVASSE